MKPGRYDRKHACDNQPCPRLSLDEAPGAFAKFDAREEGYIKVILKPTS
jgi:hypothetical protein